MGEIAVGIIVSIVAILHIAPLKLWILTIISATGLTLLSKWLKNA